jgi:hypothetical protein
VAPAGTAASGGDPAWIATGTARHVLAWTGVIGVLGTAYMWGTVDGTNAFVYQRGFMIAALLTAAIIASVVCAQREIIAVILAWAPFRFLGRISYGMYLWHFPLFLWLNHGRTGLLGIPLFAVRVLVTVAVATASFYLVEQPIRRGSFFRDWRAWLAMPAAVVAVVITIVVATVAPTQALGVTPHPTSDAALYRGPPVRVLLLGDSTALTLGYRMFGDKNLLHAYDIKGLDAGILGCGVTEGSYVDVQGVHLPFATQCQSASRPSQLWPAGYQRWVDSFHPNVVAFLAGRWEVMNVVHNGKWVNILDRSYDEFLEGQLQKAVRIATSRGAHAVLFTAPCYNSGEQPDGTPWPADQPLRVEIYNRLIRLAAATDPAKVSVYDFNQLVCPNGKYTWEQGGVQVRTPDGIHFTFAGSEYLARYILPELVAQGREQMAQPVTPPSSSPSTGR